MKNIIFLIVVSLLGGCYGKEPTKTSLVGKKLPSFNILGKDSVIFSTQQIPDGRPVVLLYFSPYCPYCRAQLESITGKIDELKNIQFYLVTSFSYREMKAFSKLYKIDQYPNITIGVDTQNYFSSYFDAKGVPAIAIFSPDKKLNALFMGQMDVRQIREVAEQ